jgi:hypothetical protein
MSEPEFTGFKDLQDMQSFNLFNRSIKNGKHFHRP